MGFETLLGNEHLKSNLQRSLSKGHVSHFYLISGPQGSGKHTLSRLLAAAIQCQAPKGRPCLQCTACRKVLENIHPDFITIDDPEKKTVPVALIREARQDMYIRPNEGTHKIYLFPRAQDMGLEGQNALLKVLEEPPAYGVFLLLTDNPDKLLPTVRSRCTELKMQPLAPEKLTAALKSRYPSATVETLAAAVRRSGGFLGQAVKLMDANISLPAQTAALFDAISRRDVYALLQVLVPMEKQKRDALGEFLESWLEIAEEALTIRCGAPGLSPLAQALAGTKTEAELYAIIGHFKKCLRYVSANVSPAAVCGYLEWALR